MLAAIIIQAWSQIKFKPGWRRHFAIEPLSYARQSANYATTRAITFDLDGVYFPDGKSTFVKNIMARGVPEIAVKRVFADSDEMNQRYKLGTMTDEEFWAWAANEWQLGLPPESPPGRP